MGKTAKIVTIILWALIIVSTILLVSLFVNISDVDTDPTMGRWINSNLVWSYILVAIGAGVAVLSGLFHMFTDKKAAKSGLIALGFMAVVVVAAYLLASPEIPQFIGVDKFLADGTLNERVAKLTDTGLYATYILLGLAVLSVASSAVMRLFR
ncbi:hypothetical protein [Draconibacterium orientale]|uniref:hypothetical protein n=1 Tax=Draconibacterium orientale TaxID=1168034 RepID=UPI002A0A35B8|nr:hypothetical protein [Draconibacterium orientale]